MSEETEANPASGDEVTPEQAQAVLTPDEGAEGEDGVQPDEDDDLDKLVGADEEEDEGQPEVVEIDLDGKKYQVHPDLKDGYLRQADYTKKTMSLAEERKAFEATKTTFDEIANLTQESRASLVQAAAMRLQLESLLNTPVDNLTQDQITALRLDVNDMESQIAALEGKGKHAEEQARQYRSQQAAKARENVVAETAKHIRNFNDQRRQELESVAVTLGASPDFVQQITDPLVYKTLHYADIGLKYEQRQKKAKTLSDAQQARPAAQMAGKAQSAKNPSSMSPAEMAKLLGY